MKKKDTKRIEELSAVIGGVLRYHKPETVAEVAEAVCAAGYCKYNDAAIEVLTKLAKSVNKQRAEYMLKAKEAITDELYMIYRSKAAEAYAILTEICNIRNEFVTERNKANECEEVGNTDG